MKIGILTQPLHNNYGGLLQNYALKTVLKELGHEVYTINIKGRETPKFRRYASILKRSAQRLLGQQLRVRTWPTAKESAIISQHTREFIQRNIITTELFSSKVDEKLLDNYKFEAYVVGSDQVWRPKYSPQLPTYFLDFLENNPDVIKIAYAASFGVDDWEFTNIQTKEFSKLLKQFNAVSVREDSAVELCKNYFGVGATQLLDPTMLLGSDVYTSLVVKEKIEQSPGNLFTYILDKSDEKIQIIDNIALKYGLQPFSVMPEKSFSEPGRKDINDCVYPPPEKWIKGFMDAKFVVTDSFHGTVFSILFNKPFISIANKGRGLTRFTSLLKLFQIEDRLILSSDSFNPEKVKAIYWERTNSILKNKKEESLQFLKEHLKKI